MKSTARAVLLLSALIGLAFGSPIDIESSGNGIPIKAAAADLTYRLPTNVWPSRYELEVTPFFAADATHTAFSFDGTVSITLRATEAGVREIVLHKKDMEIKTLSFSGAIGAGVAYTTEDDTLRDFWKIKLSSQDLPTTGDSILTINYVGQMRDDMHGFYQSYYMEGGQKVWMASTQFQQTEARRAFPCFDVSSLEL